MAKKTRAQKKRADERKTHQPIVPYSEAAPTPLPTNNIEIRGLSLDTKKVKAEGRLATPTHPYLKKDLVKVGVLVVGAVILELSANYLVTSGALSRFGIS